MQSLLLCNQECQEWTNLKDSESALGTECTYVQQESGVTSTGTRAELCSASAELADLRSSLIFTRRPPKTQRWEVMSALLSRVLLLPICSNCFRSATF